MIQYEIEHTQLSNEQRLFLENVEMEFKQEVTKMMTNYRHLRVLLSWSVCPRKEQFFELTSNADFDIAHSLSLHDAISKYLKNRLAYVDFEMCSLRLNIEYKKRKEQQETDSPSSGSNSPFFPQKPRYSFEQIILPEDTRKRILNNLNTIKHQDLIYHKWGFVEVDSKPKSILNFFGPPGTGKTMCAHAIANMLNRQLLALNYSEIESKYVGDAAKNLKRAFDTATELNAVMFFDEADSFLGKRIENVSQGADQALNSLRSQMLILLEEFEGVVLFATNLVTNFDKAFESRILDHIKLELPNKEARADIINKMLPQKLPLEKRFTQEELLEASDLIEGFAGREIKSAILSMLLDKAGEGEDNAVFTFENLKTALSKKKAQIDKLKQEEVERRKSKIIKSLQDKLEEEDEIAKHRRKRKKSFKSHKETKETPSNTL